MRRALATFGILAFLVFLPCCLHYFFPATAALDSCKVLREAIQKQDELNDAAVETVMMALRPLDPSKCLALAVRRPPGPNLAPVAREGVPVVMRNAPSLEEKEISAVINACMDRRRRGEFSGYAASKQCAAFRLVFGMDLAMRDRDPECISNELRPECAYDRKKSEATTITIPSDLDPSKLEPFFLDWNPATRRCFVVRQKPSNRNITGGGPFQTFNQAVVATLSVAGCQPSGKR